MTLKVGDKVKIKKYKISWGFAGGFDKKFFGKTGRVVEVFEVTPSKRVPEGKLVRVYFEYLLNPRTKKRGIKWSFPIGVVDKLEKSASTILVEEQENE